MLQFMFTVCKNLHNLCEKVSLFLYLIKKIQNSKSYSCKNCFESLSMVKEYYNTWDFHFTVWAFLKLHHS